MKVVDLPGLLAEVSSLRAIDRNGRAIRIGSIAYTVKIGNLLLEYLFEEVVMTALEGSESWQEFLSGVVVPHNQICSGETQWCEKKSKRSREEYFTGVYWKIPILDLSEDLV